MCQAFGLMGNRDYVTVCTRNKVNPADLVFPDPANALKLVRG
jgi:hypothetical protein